MSDRVGLVDLAAPLPHVQFVDLGLGGEDRRGGGGGSSAGQAAGAANWSEPAVSVPWGRGRARSRCLVDVCVSGGSRSQCSGRGERFLIGCFYGALVFFSLLTGGVCYFHFGTWQCTAAGFCF